MQLQTDWSFEEALQNINSRYPPWGRIAPQLRNRQLEAWGQLVGRKQSLILFDLAVKQNGSLSALGRNHSITIDTLREIRRFFENLPDDLLSPESKIIKDLQRIGQESKTVDAKRELILREVGDKAEFVKDIVAMANNGEPSYLVIGLEDETFTPIGQLNHHYNTNDINQILSDKIDPPVVIGYKEVAIDENEFAIIEIHGQNPPYIVARDLIHNQTDRKRTRVYKGTIYVRHADRTEGISRSELEQILQKTN